MQKGRPPENGGSAAVSSTTGNASFSIFSSARPNPKTPFAEKPSRQILFSELVESPYVRAAYRTVTRRTFRRELARLADIGFIVFRLPEGSDQPIVEIDFGAIGRY